MTLRLNEAIERVAAPPIAEAAGWVSGARLSDDEPLLDLAQAVPNYDPAADLLRYLSQSAGEAASAFYTPILGLPTLRKAVAEAFSKDYDNRFKAEEVAITTGCNHAFCMATAAVAGAGDEIILPEPFYFNHDMWFTMQGIRKVALPCRAEAEGMVPDPEEAAALVTPRTRAIVLISPNNPTGTIYSNARLLAFYQLAERHGMALILDETYKDFRPRETESVTSTPHTLFQLENWQDVLIQLYSFSKSYSLTGYRVGSLIAGPHVMGAVEKIADTVTICPPHIGQRAALYALQHLEDWREEKRTRVLDLIDALDAAYLKHAPRFELISRGAFFAYLRHPFEDRTSIEVAKELVRHHGLLLLPGAFFGGGQDRYLRAAFANADVDALDAFARRLAAASL